MGLTGRDVIGVAIDAGVPTAVVVGAELEVAADEVAVEVAATPEAAVVVVAAAAAAAFSFAFVSSASASKRVLYSSGAVQTVSEDLALW
jgi:hypothetical protein